MGLSNTVEFYENNFMVLLPLCILTKTILCFFPLFSFTYIYIIIIIYFYFLRHYAFYENLGTPLSTIFFFWTI